MDEGKWPANGWEKAAANTLPQTKIKTTFTQRIDQPGPR